MKVLRVRFFSWILAGLFLAACTDTNVTRAYSGVVPITGAYTAHVSAEDIVQAMLRGGFTREEILDYGLAIRNALSMQGGAEVRRGGEVTAVLSLMDESLYMVSQRGGTYVRELIPAP